MPQVRPFRALRYDTQAVGDLARVVAPPYDVISAELQRSLLERHPANVVRLDLPPAESGDEPDDRYRRAPAASVIAVAAAGDVMPETSTYFHPKALTGLVINPHEW